MTRIFMLLIALLIISTITVPAGQALAQSLDYTGCGGVAAPPVANATYEQSVIELVNAERAANGNLPPLKRVDPLDAAGRYHAIDMQQDRYFEHDTYDRNTSGGLVQICSVWQRLATYYTGASATGENIAAGQTTPNDVMADWMASPGHRANILSTTSWEVGVGYAAGGYYGSYWVLDFGRRNAVYPLVINREEDTVTTPNVNLYLYGSGVWSEMRLRNDNDAWGNWQSFQKDVGWRLKEQAGLRTVWVEMRQGTQTYLTSDTIYYSAPVTGFDTIVYLPFATR